MATGETSGEAPDRFVPIGEIVKPIGLRGEVKLYPLLDYCAALLDGRYLVWADGTAARISGHRPAGTCEALRIDGVDDRDGAEALVGRELGFRSRDYLAADFPRPTGGLPFRWLDREVRTADGRAVGKVVEVRRTGAGHLLVVPDPEFAGREILIPAVPPILRPDEGLTGALIIDPPEGLLDAQHE